MATSVRTLPRFPHVSQTVTQNSSDGEAGEFLDEVMQLIQLELERCRRKDLNRRYPGRQIGTTKEVETEEEEEEEAAAEKEEEREEGEVDVEEKAVMAMARDADVDAAK